MQTLDQLFNVAVKGAKENFARSGQVLPVFLAQTKDGQIVPVGAPMGSHEDKEKLATALKKLFKEIGVQQYIFISEAWTLDHKSPAAKEIATRGTYSGSLADHPDRREAVCISGESKDRSILGIMYILRPETGKPSLSELHRQDGIKSEGKFADLLT